MTRKKESNNSASLQPEVPSGKSQPGRFTLPKSERLCKKLVFDHLFAKGSSVAIKGWRAVYAVDLPPDWVSSNVIVGFAVPKRQFKKAVDRNRVKRLMKEAYRLQKHALIQSMAEKEKKLAVIFICGLRNIPDHAQTNEAILGLLHKLVKVT